MPEIQNKQVPDGSWSQFAHRWTNEVTRMQYAAHVQGLPTTEAIKFSRGTIPGQTLAEIKLWHHDLVASTLPDSPQMQEISHSIKATCTIDGRAGLKTAALRIKDLFRSFEFPDIKHVAWNLTLRESPIAGIIVGLAMEQSGHPKDGESLIRQALIIFGQNHALADTHEAIIADFSKRFSPAAMSS